MDRGFLAGGGNYEDVLELDSGVDCINLQIY